MRIADLELSIRPHGGGYAAEVRLRHPGSDADTAFITDAPVALDRSALLALALDTTAYGQALTAQLFASEGLRDAWRSARVLADSIGLPLRLRLRLPPGAEDFHTLRWETLRDPLTNLPLATDTRVRLVRYLDSADTRPILAGPRPDLRALLVIANPRDLGAYGLAEIDVEGEVGRMWRALGSIPLTVVGDRDSATGRKATMRAIEEALRAEPTILCLVCHGRQDGHDTMLWLEDDEGQTRHVSGSMLSAMIAQLACPPLLAALIACDTGGALASLGPRLAQGGLGAVVAMQSRLSISAARAFLPTLFTELVRDGAIDRAVAVARAALRDGDEWWTPALWLRMREGRLWAARTERPIDEALAQLAAMPVDSIPSPTPPPPGSHMPLARNPLFVGRESDLRGLAMALKGARGIAAIGEAVVSTGMGGIGKTNLGAGNDCYTAPP